MTPANKGIFFSFPFLFFFLPFLMASDAPVTIVALGDSTTAGTPAFRSPAEAPPEGSGNPESQYAYWMIKNHPEWKVMNRGINGQRSDEILNRFDKDVAAFAPQIVIVLAGVNDLYQGYPVDWIQEHLKAIYERAAQKKIKVLACTIIPYNQSSPEIKARMRDVNQWIENYAREKELGFCDTFHVAEDPSNPGNLASTPDGLHPDVEGYKKMGSAIAEAIEKILK